jgi:tetratricopeptide (TPR) repeat protein
MGCLDVVDVQTRESAALSSECTSFCVSGGYLAYTTRSHVLQCVPIISPPSPSPSTASPSSSPRPSASPAAVASLLSRLGQEPGRADEAAAPHQAPSTTSGMVRPIDRGSVIVCALPNDVRIVLQAPRGNLETIAPRPLVLAEVWRLATAREYGAAFRLSRQQRVDMNIMVDANAEEFLRSVDRLIEEVPVPGHLSVFLTYQTGSDDRVNAVCDAVVDAIDGVGDAERTARLTTTVLTALTRRRPPLLGAALRRVRASYERSEAEGASALDFLLVLSKDEELLYDEALGSYDVKLALMVAKASQMDPADYSNELRALRSMDERHRRHAIDMKLERYESALENLFACGPPERTACLALARDHAVYVAAMRLFKDDAPAISQLRQWYASHLTSADRHGDAAVVHVANGDLARAAVAYRDGGQWRLALSSFSQAQAAASPPSDEGDTNGIGGHAGAAAWREGPARRAFGESVADSLSERGDAVSAAAVRWHTLRDLDGALDDLIGAQEWHVALEMVSTASAWRGVGGGTDCAGAGEERGRGRVVAELRDAAEVYVADLKDNAAKLRERTARLVAVREAKARMRTTLGTPGGGDGGDADSDAFSASTGASSFGSFGSDMTFASSTATARTQTSLYHSIGRGAGGTKAVAARERRAGKAARKRVRSGHPKEEEALVATLQRLVPNSFLRDRLGKSISALAHLRMLPLAVSLSDALGEVLARCRELPEDLLALDDVQAALGDRSCRMDITDDLAPSL